MTFKIALLGTVGHTGLVLNGIDQIEDCELVAVCPAEPGGDLAGVQRSRAFNERTQVFDDPRTLLDQAKPDAVGVCMPLHSNHLFSRMALERGMAVVSEKPLAFTLEDLHTLKNTAAHSSGRITAMYALRFAEDFHAAKKVVEAGTIGRVVLGFSQKSYQWGKRDEWFRHRETYGGTVPWVGIHAIDSLRWAIGQEFVSVRGLHANLVHTDYPGCEDCSGVVFELEGGGQAVMTLDFLRPAQASKHGDDRLRLAGSKGVVEVRLAEGFTEVVTHDEPPRPLEIADPVPFIVDFVREIREGIPHRISQEDAFRVTEIALLAREACDRRETVSLL